MQSGPDTADALEDVPSFARQGFFGPGISELILQRGQAFRRDDAALAERWQGLRLPKKRCYQNCTELAFQHPGELLYVEGYAFADIPLHFPIAHAWLETSSGVLLDPTWQGGSGYWGIAFPAEELREYLLLSEQYGILESLWMKPALREKFMETHSITLSI